MKTIKWLLFHEPAELFIRTAEHFEKELNRRTGNAFNFEILELSDYERKYHGGKQCDPLTELKAGKVQMSQIYINTLAYSNITNLLALTLPFLFRDHDHATRVFEGEIGAEMLDYIQSQGGMKGLSFTYSGGYKVMACDQPVTSVEDFKYLKFKRSKQALLTDVFSTLGAQESDTEFNFVETTLPRYHADCQPGQSHAINTQHSMYLTTILANDAMWNEMDVFLRRHFTETAKICAAQERRQSVQDAHEIATQREKQKAVGITQYHELKDFELLESQLSPVIDRWKDYFPNNVVNRIIAA